MDCTKLGLLNPHMQWGSPVHEAWFGNAVDSARDFWTNIFFDRVDENARGAPLTV
jgi:hypothetical protein